jgi:hypothetical protein
MTMRRLLVVMLLGAIPVIVGNAASAQVYPPAGATFAIDPSLISCGGSVTATGSGWQAGATITLTLASDPQTVGTAVVASDGTFNSTFTPPSTLDEGAHTVTASGTAANGLHTDLSTTLTVRSCPAAGAVPVRGGALAFTGSDNTGLIVAIAVLLLLLGAVLTIAAARRRKASLEA